MIEQIGNTLAFYGFFVASGVGATGLTVTIDVYRNGTQIVTGGSTTEVGGGLYRYTLAAASVTVEGEYAAIFKTTGTADQKHIPALWTVGHAGLENLDATISSRATAGSSVTYVGPVASDGSISIVRGDDYKGSRALTFTSAEWPTLTGATVVLTAMSGTTVKLGPIIGTVTGTHSLSLELTAAQTGALVPAVYAFDIQATLADASIATLLLGKLTCLSDRTL
jgi:hypothetical protein